MTTPVIYDISIGKHKPHSGTQTSCPFCHRETLTDILDEKGDIIWLMNKYPVFRNTYPTVIIESAVHEADLTEYTKESAASHFLRPGKMEFVGKISSFPLGNLFPQLRS